VINPATEQVVATVEGLDEAATDEAIARSRKAFSSWRAISPGDRARLLRRFADAVDADRENLARIEVANSGHTITNARWEAGNARDVLAYYAGAPERLIGQQIPVADGIDVTFHEPLGVVGAIVPWNFPMPIASWAFAPALAAGNTVVLKPAELTPLSSLAIAELVRDVGFPPGVVNIIPGYGATAGQRLAEHDRVAKLSFTGSTATGRKLVAASAGNLKKLQLELGGKGPNIVFGDANLDAAIAGSAFAIFHNQGQACIAGSRLILHESIAGDFLGQFIELAESIRLGDPLDPTTEMGPLTSAGHRDRVLSYVQLAREEGGEVLTGGSAPDDRTLGRGFYLRPTVVRADPSSRVCREEVFGPFVTVTTFRSDEEAIAIANDVDYGLGGGLWTRDLSRAHSVASRIRAGMVWINSYKRINPGSPFGGTGLSGYGREMGFEAMREYTEPKSVWVNVDAAIPPFYPRP